MVNYFVGANSGRLYLSTDGGKTWSEVRPAGDSNLNWMTSGMSSDGKTILAGIILVVFF